MPLAWLQAMPTIAIWWERCSESRNNWFLALFTMGEGWHYNHHAFQSSAKQGFRWWETDTTYYVLVVLSWFRIVWDLKGPSEQVLRTEHRLGSRVVRRTAEQLVRRFNPEHIALAIKTSVHESELLSIHERLFKLGHRTDSLWHRHLSSLPTREVILAEARNMFPNTISLDDIVDCAYQRLVEAVGALIVAP